MKILYIACWTFAILQLMSLAGTLYTHQWGWVFLNVVMLCTFHPYNIITVRHMMRDGQ